MTELLAGLGGVGRWFLDPVHWQGAAGVPTRVAEHLLLSIVALLLAAAIGLPVGVGVGHTGRGAGLAVNLANLGRALPTLAVMGIVLPVTAALDSQLGFKVYPALIALVVLGIPPILVNAYAGIAGVDRDIVESGRGLGMRARELLALVEIPLALPVIVAGIRSATAQILATATLAAIFGGPGLGRYLIEGYAQLDYPMMFAGVILVGLLFLVSEAGFSVLQTRLVRRGIRPRRDQDMVRAQATLGA
jgi:osmoprotectant transport system permease protein